MAEVEVQTTGEDEQRFSFDVSVTEAGSTSRHQVTLARDDYVEQGDRWSSPDEYVRRCFEFLLEREPKESILARFDIRDIGTYFPEFKRGIV